MTNHPQLPRTVAGPRRSRGVGGGGVRDHRAVAPVPVVAGAEFGRAFVQYDTLSYSIRNSARFVSEHAINGTTGVVRPPDA